ncbi:MAG: BolA family protein [Bdellovibrionales bacterium]
MFQANLKGMNRPERVEAILRQALAPGHLQVLDESHMHGHHAKKGRRLERDESEAAKPAEWANQDEIIPKNAEAAKPPIGESSQTRRPRAVTHLRVVIVSEAFCGMSRVARQQKVYALLDSELKSGLHALALRTLTPEEWKNEGGVDNTKSPPCASKK